MTYRNSPRESHQSAGQAESAGDLNRKRFVMLRSTLQMRTGYDMDPETDLGKWAIRHAAFLRGRGDRTSNGKTSYFNVHGLNYTGELCEFGEVVRWKVLASKRKNKAKSAWRMGVWRGKLEATDEHIVGNRNGVEFPRTVRRVPERLRWQADFLRAFRGVPWRPVPPKDADDERAECTGETARSPRAIGAGGADRR